MSPGLLKSPASDGSDRSIMHKTISFIRENARYFWLVILGFTIAVQLIFLFDKFILPWGWRVKQVWDEPRLVRSADMSLGAQARKTISLIVDVVPEDATILLPPIGEPGRFSLTRSMQYFFFPRTPIQCDSLETQACQQALGSTEIYILATEDFPPSELTSGREFFEAPQIEGWWFKGIYGPEFEIPSEYQKMTISSYSILFFQDAAIVIALIVLGVSLLLPVRTKWSLPELLSLAFPTGAGLFTFLMFLLSWMNIQLNPNSVGLLYAALAVILFLIIKSRVKKIRHSIDWPNLSEETRPSRFSLILLIALFCVCGLSVAFSVGLSYRLTDPVQIWSVKGYGISHMGSILGAKIWGVHNLAYPLNIPLQVSIFHLMNGDVLPGSKLIYPLFSFSLYAALYAFLRQKQVNQEESLLGVLLVATVPIFFFHSVSGFANLPYTFYLVAGILWVYKGVSESIASDQLIGSLLLGLAAWTRPEGIVFCVGTLVILWLSKFVVKMGRYNYAALILPLAFIAIPWFVFSFTGSYMEGSNLDQAVNVYSTELFRGNIDLSGLVTLVSVFSRVMFVPSITATTWGMFFPIVLILLFTSLKKYRPINNPGGFILVLQTIFVAITTVGIFYIRSYSKGGYASFIERSFPRAFLPAAILFAFLGLSALGIRMGYSGHRRIVTSQINTLHADPPGQPSDKNLVSGQSQKALVASDA